MKGWRKTANGKEPSDPRMQQIVFRSMDGYKHITAQFLITIGRVCEIRRQAGIPRRTRVRDLIS